MTTAMLRCRLVPCRIGGSASSGTIESFGSKRLRVSTFFFYGLGYLFGLGHWFPPLGVSNNSFSIHKIVQGFN
jgi:hypothetical protein